eukprot:576558-Amphidinium_carterae.1
MIHRWTHSKVLLVAMHHCLLQCAACVPAQAESSLPLGMRVSERFHITLLVLLLCPNHKLHIRTCALYSACHSSLRQRLALGQASARIGDGIKLQHLPGAICRAYEHIIFLLNHRSA